MTKPPFDFPGNAEDGDEFFPNENDKNLGYTWVEDGQYWSLIKQIPNPDVTKEYVDGQIQILETEISNLVDIVQESAQITASLDYKFKISPANVAAYNELFASCMSGEDSDAEDLEAAVHTCRLSSRTIWEGSPETLETLKGEFQTLDSGLEGNESSFSDVFVIDICEQDLNGNLSKWWASSGGAVEPGDNIQIVRFSGEVEDSSNYGYYKVVSGKMRQNRGNGATNEAEYNIQIDFEHGKGSLVAGESYRIRGIRTNGALTIGEADAKYVQVKNTGVQTVVGELRVKKVLEDSDNTVAATKEYVDERQQDAVPVGSVIAFTGAASTIPDGWLLCGGETFNSNKYPKLKQLFPNNTLPDFRGHFLVGYGADGYGTFLGKYEQSTARPKNAFKTNSYSHSHAVNDGVYLNKDAKTANKGAQVNYTSTGYQSGTPASMGTNINNHVHDVNVGGDTHTRPNSYAINWIIKAG